MAKFSIKRESVLKSIVWSNFNNFHREGKKIHYAYSGHNELDVFFPS